MQDPKTSPKIRHLGTIAQLCRAMYPHTSSQYGELRPTSGSDPLASLGHPSKFQWVLLLGSITARHSSSGRQPNFTALNRGRHLYLAGWPSRWALAHILVCDFSVRKTSRMNDMRLMTERDTVWPSINPACIVMTGLLFSTSVIVCVVLFPSVWLSLLPLARRLFSSLFVCLSVCFSVSNFAQKLPNSLT